MKRIKFLIFFIFLPIAANASCTWQQTFSGGGVTSGGCGADTTLSNSSSCAQPAPPITMQGENNVCCCPKTVQPPTSPVPNPSQETCSWDGDYYNGYSMHTACTNGRKVSDNYCAGSKPTDFSNIQCCCIPIIQPSAPAPSTPPKFIIPEFQIPIDTVKLSTPTSTNNKLIISGSNGNYSYQIPWIAEYIQGVYNYGLSIAGILAAIVLMAGGLLWLTSGGNDSKITQAKELISGSVTGLIILFFSYIILVQINPDLTQLVSIGLGNISHQELELADTKLGNTAEQYKDMGCPSDSDLAAGVQFYATGYYKVPFQADQDLKYLCMVHMQGTCPNNTNTSAVCAQNGTPIFPNYPNYQPCNQFTQEQYQSYFNRPDLIVGQTIAGPIKCGGKLAKNNQVCFKGHTYKITDSGGGIQGRRIDILSSSLQDCISNSGVGTLKSGPCQ